MRKRETTTVLFIGSQQWEFVLLSDVEYNKKFGTDSCGICLTDKHQVFFKKKEFTPRTVMHEVIHALCASAHIDSADLDSDQFEEVLCEMISVHFHNIGAWTDHIFHKLH